MLRIPQFLNLLNMIVGKARAIYFGRGFHVKITEFPSHFCVAITRPLWYIVWGTCDWLLKPFGERERGGPYRQPEP